jgi:trimeric autotransporter adhesin
VSKLKAPSPGAALGLLALIVALVGTANAGPSQTIVRKGDIAKGAVTARALAKGAVRAPKLANGAVTARALASGSVTAAALKADAVTAAAIRQGSVGSNALAPNAVTSAALAPGSVYGAALGPVAVHTTPIADLDQPSAPDSWTASNTEHAICAPGERLLTGGVGFTNPGSREVGVIELRPYSTGPVDGVAARLTSNSGGSATAEVQVICLK